MVQHSTKKYVKKNELHLSTILHSEVDYNKVYIIDTADKMQLAIHYFEVDYNKVYIIDITDIIQ